MLRRRSMALATSAMILRTSCCGSLMAVLVAKRYRPRAVNRRHGACLQETENVSFHTGCREEVRDEVGSLGASGQYLDPGARAARPGGSRSGRRDHQRVAHR